jgi:hypothetical protein
MNRRPRSNGKWWLLLIVVVFGLALWYRLRSRDDRAVAPLPPPTPQPSPPKPHAEPVRADAGNAEPRAPYESRYWPHALSSDGKRALLLTGSHPYQDSLSYPETLRIVAIDTGEVEAELAFHAYGADKPDPAALAEELTRARALLRGFPLGAAGMLATSADGTAGGLSGPDSVLPMRGEHIGTALKVAAAYDPMMLDDNTLLVRAYHGRDSDGEGVYALAWASLDSPVVHAIEGTVDYNGGFALSESGDMLRILIRQAPGDADCVVEIALAKPLRATRKRCLDNTKNVGITLSAHGTWVAWRTQLGDNAPTRLRTMNIDTGEVGIDVSQAADAQTGERGILVRGFVVVTDTGRVVVEDFDGRVRAIDPATKTGSPVTLPHPGLETCLPRGDRELVCEDHGSVRVAKF